MCESLVSVVIPVYNREELAIRAVESVYAQDYSEIELIVVDDGSDSEPINLKKLIVSNNGTFIRIPHRGVARARNVAILESRGGWIALLDSDDAWLPSKISTQMRYLQEHKSIKLCQGKEVWYRDGQFVNPRLRHEMPNGDGFERSLELCCISASSIIFPKELFVSVGGFCEELAICEDYDYWLRLTAHYPIASLPEPMVEKFGGRGDQLSRSQKALDRFRIYAILRLLLYGALASEQYSLALATLRQKSNVMLQGVSKRGDQLRCSRYQRILTAIDEGSIASSCAEKNGYLDMLLEAMKPEIEMVIR